MSNVDHTFWRNPHTVRGLPLPATPPGEVWQIHEAGTSVLHEDWLYRKVSSPFWRLYHSFSTGVWVYCGGKRHLLDPNKIAILPAGMVFDCGSATSVRHLWLHFSLPMVNPAISPDLLEIDINRAARAVIASLQRTIKAQEAEESRHLAAALLHIVFAQLGQSPFLISGPRLQRVLTWLERHLSKPISNRLLAAQAGLGVEPFIRWFKLQTGRTPASYVAETRVREACRRLVYEDQTIEQIAESVGFKNRHHFSRVFKQYAGCGPASFRHGQGR